MICFLIKYTKYSDFLYLVSSFWQNDIAVFFFNHCHFFLGAKSTFKIVNDIKKESQDGGND